MLRELATLIIFLALLVGVLACTSADNGVATKPAVESGSMTIDEVPRITPEELKAEQVKGSVTVIDVRGPTSYEAAHMPGALEIAEMEIRSRSGELPRDGLIVTYCV